MFLEILKGALMYREIHRQISYDQRFSRRNEEENLVKFTSGSLLILFFPQKNMLSALSLKNKFFPSDYLFMKLSNTSLASRERRKTQET